MSENEKNPTPGELISVQQLDAVAGGGYGDITDPRHDSHCWFRADGEPREDGRTRCRSECKGILVNGKPVSSLVASGSEHANNWFICPCWGSDSCVDRWHKPCGKPPRADW